MDHLMFPLVVAVVAVFGLCLGSFATALVYRLPRHIPWIVSQDKKLSRSACPQCQAALRWCDLVPVLSWLSSRGRCRHCGGAISPRYPLIELTTMILILALFWAWDMTPLALLPMLAVPFLVAGFLIDWDHMILPDDINASLMVLAVIYVYIGWENAARNDWMLTDPVLASALLTGSISLAAFILSRIKGRSALGWGDVKFLVPAGLFLGMDALPSFMMLAGLVGLGTAVLQRRKVAGGAFPFGPGLIISLYVHFFLTGLGFDYTW